MTKAFGYLRVSGKSQLAGDGMPRQLLAIRAYAAAHDIRIVQVFEERGVCGAVEGMDRPSWSEMIAAILVNGVRTILVESLNRLARDLFVQEYILRDMKARGITLISVTEPDLDSADPTRIMFRQILGAIHQYEKAMIVAKLRGARARQRAKEGRCEGRKPYGHYEAEKATLVRMRELREAGRNHEQIAVVLNVEGVPPRSGMRWYGKTISNILGREV